MASNKKARRELAQKKAKQKKILIFSIGGALILAIAAVIIVTAVNAANTETYSSTGQSIRLNANGEFSASLFHGSTYGGTYEKTDGSVIFTYGETTAIAMLDGDTLFLPPEWDDGHGHGSVLTRR